MYEAKQKVDNFSQIDAFFNAVNRNVICMKERPTLSFPLANEPSNRFKNTPFANKQSMIGVKKLPKPSPELQKILNEDVYQYHHESSDDELMTDQAYKEASQSLVHELVYSLKDDQVDDIYENIVNHNYENIKDNG